MSRRMAFLHLPPIRWLTSFYNPPSNINENNQLYKKVILGPNCDDIDYIGPYIKLCNPIIDVVKTKNSYRK